MTITRKTSNSIRTTKPRVVDLIQLNSIIPITKMDLQVLFRIVELLMARIVTKTLVISNIKLASRSENIRL